MRLIVMLLALLYLVWAINYLWRQWAAGRDQIRDRAAIRDAEVAAGKRCPSCFGKCLIRLPSMSAKLCADCHEEIPWHLSEGQVQTLAPSRAHRKVIPQ